MHGGNRLENHNNVTANTYDLFHDSVLKEEVVGLQLVLVAIDQ